MPRIMLNLIVFLMIFLGVPVRAAVLSPGAEPAEGEAVHVILFVLEGVDRPALKAGPMPVISRLVKQGSATWSAEAASPSLRLPAMASLFTGLPVTKHGITWESFEFSRGYPRPPTLFDYLDLSGGRDSAIFLMDESLYQLAKPEPYTDYQLCGLLKPECSPQRLVSYIKQYFAKAASGHGYGHAILALPHLLVVHLPEAGRAGQAHGWSSNEYRHALRSVDQAMGAVLDIYRSHGLLARTSIVITSLNGPAASQAGVPWIAAGSWIKSGYTIREPMSIIDTGATVMRMMGLQTHTEWDSHVVEEIFRGGPLTRLTMRKEPERP
jgi:arylsulfatase A-like enzyme